MTPGDWHRIIAAFTILGVLWAIGGFIAANQYSRLERDEDRLEQLGINVTASLCLQAYAPEEGDPSERDLVAAFVEGDEIRLDNQVCRQAVEITRRQIEGKEPD